MKKTNERKEEILSSRYFDILANIWHLNDLLKKYPEDKELKMQIFGRRDALWNELERVEYLLGYKPRPKNLNLFL